jgi:hypothetical protein
VTSLLRAAQLDERKFAIVGLLWCALSRVFFYCQMPLKNGVEHRCSLEALADL